MAWYAIFVQTGKEDCTIEDIKNITNRAGYENNYHMIVPKRILDEYRSGNKLYVISKLFPGYVLLYADDILRFSQAVCQCKYIIKFLKQDDLFLEIEENEMHRILTMIDDDNTIGVSEIFIENDIVKVFDGPLVNYTGRIYKIDKRKQRAKIAFDFDGSKRLIDISVRILEKIKDNSTTNIICFAGEG